MNEKTAQQGVLCALGAYFIWGLAPAYFKLIDYVPANEILAHRILWSAVFMLVLLTLGRRWPQVRRSFRRGKLLLALALASVLIGSNWLLFILVVNHHHILEASLGYFINPLVNVLLGMLFWGERFRRLQWLAVVLGIRRRAGAVVDVRLTAAYRLGTGAHLCLVWPAAKKARHRRPNRHADRNSLAAACHRRLPVSRRRHHDQPPQRQRLAP